jgi:hypothetical protein
MLDRRLVALVAAGLVCAAMPALAQVVVVGGGVWLGGGAWYGAPLLWSPAPVPWPHAGAWHPYAAPSANYRSPDHAPSCLRIGRCTVAELQYYYRRPETLERRAPTAPEPAFDATLYVPIGRPGIAPTSDEAVQPEYQGASLPRDAFSESGKPLERGADAPR